MKKRHWQTVGRKRIALLLRKKPWKAVWKASPHFTFKIMVRFVGSAETAGERKYFAVYLNGWEQKEWVFGNKEKKITPEL